MRIKKAALFKASLLEEMKQFKPLTIAFTSVKIRIQYYYQ